MKRSLRFVGVFVLLSLLVGGCGQLFGQTTVADVGNVKKPKEGKLYFAEKDGGLYLFNKGWNKVALASASLTSASLSQQGSISQQVVTPPMPPVTSAPLSHQASLSQQVVLPDVFARNGVVKSWEHVGYVWQEPIFKITFVDEASRSYRLSFGNLESVGNNVYEHPAFRLNTGLNINIVKNGIIDIFTAGGGLAPDGNAFKFEKVGFVNPIPTPTRVDIKFPTVDELLSKVNVQAPSGTLPIAIKTKPLLLHVWGNGGDRFNGGQGTQREERYMLSQPWFRDQLPFYGYDTEPREVVVDVWQNKQIVGKKTVTATVDYLMDDAAMAQTIDYVKRAKLDGFNFLFYADDGILKEWRQSFVRAADKKGLKMAFNLGSFGGGFEQWPNDSEYKRSLTTITNLMRQDYYQRVDGLPVLSYMIDKAAVENNSDALREYLTNKKRIEELYGGKIYWILNYDFYDKGDWYKNNGFDAITSYYQYGNYVNNDFKEVIEVTEKSNADHTAAGRAVAPIITCGLDSRARNWFYYGDWGNNYYKWETVLTGLPTLIKKTTDFMSSTANVKIGFVNHADEHSEQGFGFLPTKNKAGVIQDDVVRIFEGVIR